MRCMICLAVLLALTTFASAADIFTRVKVRWIYTITPDPQTRTIGFKCLVPRDHDDWQRVVDLRLSHPPVERISDRQDAIARFFFRNAKAPITLTIDATLELRSAGLLNRRPKVGLKLDDADRRAATSSERFIESDNPKIVALSHKIAGGTVPQQLIRIQKIVADTLTRGEFDPLDHGALAAIEQGKGDCSEYADLFVALCRAKGIAAVVCEGFTVDVGLIKRQPPFHTWAMVWLDDRGWTRFDPLDAATHFAKHEAQASWYIQLTNQRNSEQIGGHLYQIDWKGAEAGVEAQFEVVE